MSAKTITIQELDNGEIYTTGPASTMCVRVNKTTSRDAVTGKVFTHVGCRQCHRPAPEDFKKTAHHLIWRALFDQQPAVRI